MDIDPAFVLVIGLGVVCAVAVVVGGIFDLIVTAYASRRLHDDAALSRARQMLAVSRRLSNPAFIGVYGSLGIAYLAFGDQVDSLFTGRTWALGLAAIVLLGLGVGQVVLAIFVNARLGRMGSGG